MEEIDEVGEVDMGFDFASWMIEEDDDNTKEEEVNFNTAEASEGKQESQQPRAPMTPTIKKILAEARGDQKPAMGTTKSGKDIRTDSLTATIQGSPTNKLGKSASTLPIKAQGTQGKVNALKSEEAKSKVEQSSAKPLTVKTTAAHVKLPPTSVKSNAAMQKGAVQKKTFAKVSESEGTVKNVKSVVEERELKPQLATRAQTRSSTKAISVTKKPIINTKTAAKPQTSNEAISPSPVSNLKSPRAQTKTNTTSVSDPINMKPPDAVEYSPQPKIPAQAKGTQSNKVLVATKMKSGGQLKPSVSATMQNTIVKSMEETTTVTSAKLIASKPVNVSSVASPIVKSMSSTAVKVSCVKQTSMNVTQKQTLKKTEVNIGGVEKSPVSKVLTEAAPVKKVPQISTTATECNKSQAVASSSAAPVLPSATITVTQRADQTKNAPSSAANPKSNGQTSSSSKVPQVVKCGSENVSSTASGNTSSSLISPQTTSTTDSNKTPLSTTNIPSHTFGRKTLLPTPPPLRAASKPSIAVRVTGSPTVPIKSSTPILSETKKMKATTASTATTSKSSSSLSYIKSPNKSESPRVKDNTTSSSSIADVMAQVIRQDAFEDMDLGLTMSMEDLSDPPTKPNSKIIDCNKKSVISNKRPSSSVWDGPPHKQMKPYECSSKAPSLLKENDCDVNSNLDDQGSKLITLSSAHDAKTKTPVLDGKKGEKNQEEKQIKNGQEEKQIKNTQDEKQIMNNQGEKQIKNIQEKTQIKNSQEEKQIKNDQNAKQIRSKHDEKQFKKYQEEDQIKNNQEEKLVCHQIQPVSKKILPPAGNESKVLSKPVKRIVRRFHRGSQTTPTEKKSKLLQCLIRVPALDNPQKSTASVSVSASLNSESEEKQTPFYMNALPSTVQQNVLDSVLLFKINHQETRQIKPAGSFTHGISIGHVTQAEMDKSLFRENIVSKSSYYSFQFNGQDGVMDLYFTHEEAFLAVMTQIRKTKIGPRYLPVTFFKVLSKKEQDPSCLQPFVRVTVVFDQNFASSSFLGFVKAPIWNKPKIEETFSVHNMPGGIPVEFLKQIIPDAVTIDVDDESLKFTQQGRRVFLGINRKTGDHVLKLFHQVYVNRHYLALARGRTTVANTLGLKEILDKQSNQRKDETSVKTLRGRSRNINLRSNQDKKGLIEDGAEVVMVVDDVPDADRMLVGRGSAWAGPSNVTQLNQAQQIPLVPGDSLSKGLPHLPSIQQDLSDISDKLSDISDDSDLGQGSDEQSKTLSTGIVGRPMSVRSFDRDSLLAKDTETKNTYGTRSESSREVSESGDSKSHGVKDLDIFGRSRGMRDKFKSFEEGNQSTSTSRPHNERERQRQDLSNYRHFLSGQTDARQQVWNAGHSEQRNYGKEKETPEKVTERDPSSKYERYSPETEWLLLNRDKEKAKYKAKKSRSRSRFKRLVEEKMRGLEDFVRGSSRQEPDQDRRISPPSRQQYSKERDFEKDRGTLKQTHRSRSPSDRHARRQRSASPVPRIRGITRKELMTGNEQEATGRKKASPPPFSISSRRITLGRRKSHSPPHRKGAGRGCSSLSPIKIDDDEEEGIDRVREKGKERQLEYNYRQSNHMQSHRGFHTKDYNQIDQIDQIDRLRKVVRKEEDKTEVPVREPSSQQSEVSAIDNDLEDSTSAEREILHEFVKQLLERANIVTSAEMEGSNFASDPPTHQAEKRMSPNTHQEQRGLHWSEDQPETALSKDQTRTNKMIPPPIPPPVMPPLFTPEPEREKNSQLESRAKQLAADIQRQQEQPHAQRQQPQKFSHMHQQQVLGPPPQLQQKQPQGPSQHQSQVPPKVQQQQQFQIPLQMQPQTPLQLQQQQQPQTPLQMQQQQQQQQYQQMFTHTMQAQPYTQTSQAQGYFQNTTQASDGLLPTPVVPVPLNRPPPQVIHTTMPSPHLMVATASLPVGIPGHPTLPLPFFPNITPSVRLQTVSNMSQSQCLSKNNNNSDVKLNPDGKFF